jgi:diacylglycerol kinase (ATP)
MHKRIRSFRYAINGIRELMATQPNARIHFAASALVISAGIFFSISALEWAALALAMGLVWAMEALNTALEYTLDRLHPERHPHIGKAKDLAAGAVLLASCSALGVGIAVFGPRVAVLIGF